MADEDDDGLAMRKALFTVSDAVLGAAVLLVIGVYGGDWLDKQLHTTPWLSVGLSIFGGGLGLARMVIKANSLDTKSIGRKTSKNSGEGKDPLPLVKSDPAKPRMPYDDYSDE